MKPFILGVWRMTSPLKRKYTSRNTQISPSKSKKLTMFGMYPNIVSFKSLCWCVWCVLLPDRSDLEECVGCFGDLA